MGKKSHNPFSKISCPICREKTITDPDAHKSPMLPPTGGDFDYTSTRLNAVKCNTCNTFFKLNVKIERVSWADSWDVEYFWEYPYAKKIEEVKAHHLIVP